MAGSKTDLIVAVDLGMTCSGVAFNLPSSGSNNIRWIQKWPGRMQANENKVPTILVYPHHQSYPSSWGFLSETFAEQNADDRDHKEWFKVYLDEDKLKEAQAKAKEDPESVPSSIAQVEKYYCDFLRSLYQYIRQKLAIEIPHARWEDASIEFVFSVPTTWKPNPVVERFRSVILKAGFGSSPSHTVSIGLTEAEAAAVHMAKEAPRIFAEKDVILVCDVGGGTTDLSALRVRGVNEGALTLEQIDVVFGANLGSTQIDRGFETKIIEKLQIMDRQAPLGINIEDAAWEMMKSQTYLNAKCDYGSPDDTPTFSVSIPKLDRSYRNDQFNVANGSMRLDTNELQSLFDQQVFRLYEMIDKQLLSLNEKYPGEQVAHLVLSGGLGNSAYIQRCVQARYAPHRNYGFPNASRLQVRVAPDPQLVVCKGLVSDRLAKLRRGKAILGFRCCRASYGIRCRELYVAGNPHHQNLKYHLEPFDGKMYVYIVDWLIKKGEPVSNDIPLKRTFQRKLDPQNPQRVFPSAIVTSDVDMQYLPYSFTDQCNKLCLIESDLTPVELTEFKLKNRHFWNRGKKHYRVEYSVNLVLGPADVTFELWFKGRKLSKDNPIRVEWEATAPPDVSQHFYGPQPVVGEGIRGYSSLRQ